MDEYEEDLPMEYSISEMMAETGLSRTGLISWLKRHDKKPVLARGRVHYYSYEVLENLMDRETRKPAKKQVKSKTSEVVKDTQESIPHLEAKINLLEAKMDKIIEEQSRHREILDL